MGFDAVDNNFGGFSYMVVLNRTKCIFLKGGYKQWKNPWED